ncbi:hypothetical protein GMRT_11091 [Giardia muris]|uniref:Uncharacterized protein n=1 Tax=Giardia muris TaxID=5742 RepID=A0A4Z1T376_GIAMU|nr:hypothetical protein GMRT_11091 [Giardia muris]|eukprot:TNJ30108.1 hypothetical protein GMRT_11091 [Giardia muris]
MWQAPNCSAMVCEAHGECDCRACATRLRSYERACAGDDLGAQPSYTQTTGQGYDYRSLNPYSLPCQGNDPRTSCCHIKPIRPTCAVPVPNHYVYKFPHNLDIEGRFSCIPHPPNQTCCGHASSEMTKLAAKSYPAWRPEEHPVPGTDDADAYSSEFNKVLTVPADRTPSQFDWDARNAAIDRKRRQREYEDSWTRQELSSRLSNGADIPHTSKPSRKPRSSGFLATDTCNAEIPWPEELESPHEYGHNSFTNKPDCRNWDPRSGTRSMRTVPGISTAN